MPTTLASFDAGAIGRRLRRSRDLVGVSRAVAARCAGLSQRDLDLVERGRAAASLEALAVLARFYGRHLDWILTGVDTNPIANAVVDNSKED